MIPSVKTDYGKLCPQCGHPVAVIDKHRYTCTNPKCDKFMRFTRPVPFARKADIQPLIRHF